MAVYGTLGGDDSNHAFVLRRYLANNGLGDAGIRYYDDFLSPSTISSMAKSITCCRYPCIRSMLTASPTM